MEHYPRSERLLKLNNGCNANCFYDYCSYYDGRGCRIWPKNISTGRIKNRSNNRQQKNYNQEEDPGEMSCVGLCRNTYFEQETHYNQQLYRSESLAVTGDPIDLCSTLSKYTTDSTPILDRPLDCFHFDSETVLLLETNVQLRSGRVANTLRGTNSLITIAIIITDDPHSLLKASSFSSLRSFTSANIDLDIQTGKLAGGSGKNPLSSASSSSSSSGCSSSASSMVKKEDTVSEERYDKETESYQAREALLLRGYSNWDTLLFARTTENKIIKIMTPALQSRHQQRSDSKTNIKTSGHNIITASTTTTTSTTDNNDCCNRSDLTNVVDSSSRKLDCSCVFTLAFSSYLGTLYEERYPPSTLLTTRSVCSKTPYTRPHTQTNNNYNYNNNNSTVNINTTILPTSQTTTTTITSTQKYAPSSIVSDLFILTYLTSMWFSSFVSNSCSYRAFLDTCRRTGSSTRSPNWKLRNYIVLALNILAFFTCVAGQCKVSTCQKQWPTYHMNTMDTDPLSNALNCRALRTTWHCIRNVSRGCVGNIDYHSEKSRVQKQMSIRKCSTQGETYDPSDQTHRPPVQRPHPECMYKGKGTYKHCGLFGDPHLRTFNRVCQTCKIRGAWPLVDNKRLTVMVTNKPVVVDGSATATSMLTVRIRRNELCGANHFVTYETQANHLPSTFDDGRTHYGQLNGIELKVLEPNKHIKIHIKYIDTTILVRQIGRYFTFALWMPEEVVDDSNGNVPELCVRGCPKSEQINYQEFLAQKRQKLMEYKTQNKLVMSRLDAETLCRQAKVVDFYFDSCVFDLMTTGDRNFTVAAYSALHDLLKLNPEVAKSNKNRTDFQRYDERYSGSASSRALHTIQKLIISCVTLLSLYTSDQIPDFVKL